ncbi:alpha/beta fold hydrolase [Nocardia crassostreae]|uniref:alpha/beta fold hydrolase n=1 Tax=Nocardia crassostreae TaxID=53428 RepID=UPI00082E9C06|nr:alpha/beta hydrolase [Nocardia crassostreae]
MPKIGRFTSAAAEATFLSVYDSVAATWPVPSTNVDVETSFGTTRVRKSGEGEGAPIMLLPGIGGNGQAWHRFIEAFARDHVVYTPDIIGWAGRCVQTSPLSDTADIAKWMTQVLDGLGVDRVHLAGNSLGAWLAGAVAVHNSERLETLTMFEPSASTFAKPQWRLLLKFLMAGLRPTPDRMRMFNKWLMPGADLTDEEFALAMAALKFRMAMPWDRPFTDTQLSAITAPTLILFGAETVVANPELAASRARTHIPSAEVDIGHDLLWANPHEVIPRFLNFVDIHDRARA